MERDSTTAKQTRNKNIKHNGACGYGTDDSALTYKPAGSLINHVSHVTRPIQTDARRTLKQT